jgi:hypothetical protein
VLKNVRYKGCDRFRRKVYSKCRYSNGYSSAMEAASAEKHEWYIIKNKLTLL